MGFVLTGGRSSRMGRDKALLPYNGATLVQAIAHQVKLAAGNVVLVGNPERYGHLGIPYTPDIYPGEGPLGGILTALQLHGGGDWRLVVACDMPAVNAAFLRELLHAAETAGADILFPVGPSARPEPLCAVYHRRARQHLYEAFARGIRKITVAAEGLRIMLYPVAELTLFQNVNTPEDWARYDTH